MVLEQWPQLLPQQSGFVPALRCLTLGKTQLGQSVTITRGLPVAYSGCLAHLPPTEALSPLSATRRATRAGMGALQLPARDSGQGSGDGGGVWRMVDEKP